MHTNRRVLARENDMTKQICYDINEIALANQARFIQQKQADQSYKRLMTSLSHDVKTPLASLVGYLEAIENGMVVGEEKEEYLRVISDKAHRLKEFVISLFEWVKLDAKEQVFHFELSDLNELTRSIIADWVPTLENSRLEYEIEIPENEWSARIDANAFTRILNNLFQNIMVHSAATYIKLSVKEDTTAIGMGVSEELGGCVEITVAVIIITGVLGNVFGDIICKIFHIKEPISKGLAFGASSHAIGTARAIEIGEVEGAMSGLAVAVSGIFTVVFASVFSNFI